MRVGRRTRSWAVGPIAARCGLGGMDQVSRYPWGGLDSLESSLFNENGDLVMVDSDDDLDDIDDILFGED